MNTDATRSASEATAGTRFACRAQYTVADSMYRAAPALSDSLFSSLSRDSFGSPTLYTFTPLPQLHSAHPDSSHHTLCSVLTLDAHLTSIALTLAAAYSLPVLAMGPRSVRTSSFEPIEWEGQWEGEQHGAWDTSAAWYGKEAPGWGAKDDDGEEDEDGGVASVMVGPPPTAHPAIGPHLPNEISAKAKALALATRALRGSARATGVGGSAEAGMLKSQGKGAKAEGRNPKRATRRERPPRRPPE